jgi:hypothetical protein
MNKCKFLFFLFIAGLVAFASCKKDDDGGGDGGIDCDTVKYSTTIAPLLQNNCNNVGCHDSGAAQTNGDYTSYAGIETVAKNDTMRQKVLIDMSMPKGNGVLTQTELDQVECWLNAGAPDN